MRYWRKGYFETFRSVAKAARTVPEREDYSAFCEKYENGLRQGAFTILDRFISSYEREAFEKRRRFVSWLSHLTFGRAGRHMAIPQPLQIRIIEPTLLEWTLVDPRSYEPHLWLGGYDHLKPSDLTPHPLIEKLRHQVQRFFRFWQLEVIPEGVG
jgi:hypothetical protein